MRQQSGNAKSATEYLAEYAAAQPKSEASDTIWQRRMSNHIAYALLVYTGLQIFMVMGELKAEGTSLLPYFGLCILVALIIPACRRFEKNWEKLAFSGLSDADLQTRYTRDRITLWALAIGLPFLFVLLFRGLAAAF